MLDRFLSFFSLFPLPTPALVSQTCHGECWDCVIVSVAQNSSFDFHLNNYSNVSRGWLKATLMNLARSLMCFHGVVYVISSLSGCGPQH